MPKRELRIVKHGGQTPTLGICERCNAQFAVLREALTDPDAALASISDQFDAHNCKPVDSSQNALRIVRESTEGKYARTPLSLRTFNTPQPEIVTKVHSVEDASHVVQLGNLTLIPPPVAVTTSARLG